MDNSITHILNCIAKAGVLHSRGVLGLTPFCSDHARWLVSYGHVHVFPRIQTWHV